MDCSVEDGVGVDFAEFTLGLVKSEVECRGGVNWRGGMKRKCGSFPMRISEV